MPFPRGSVGGAARGHAAVSAQYDGIAEGYQRTKTAPLREHVEAFSLMAMAGDVRGLDVLDLACGEGFYTRRLLQAGAARVTGVDVSAEMIALAVAEEAREPLGATYECADVGDFEAPYAADLVTAAYLLHYAPDEASLRAMCRSIANCLRPGGRLVAINEDPQQSAADYPGYTRYGFNKRYSVPRTAGSAVHYSMVAGRELIRFEVYYFPLDVYERALADAGFRDIRWPALRLSPAADLPAEYWSDYLANPPVCGLEAHL